MSHSSQRTIMVVDDDPIVLAVLTDELEASGYCVLAVASAVDCLVGLSENRIDAFVLDVLMPEMDGLSLMDAIRKRPRYRETPIVFCSSTADRPESAAAYRALGAADVVGKASVADVSRALGRIFAARGARPFSAATDSLPPPPHM